MKRHNHSVIMPNRGRIDDLRNAAVKSAMDCEEFSHILFLDIDHYHHPDTIPMLLSREQSIVSGLSFRRSEPYDPIMFKQVEDRFENVTEWTDGDLVEVDAIGAASLLVETDVFKKMQSPWFQMNYPFKSGVVSEDFAFCLKAKEKGYKIWCDTSCTNNHIGVLNVNKDVWVKHNGLERQCILN